MDEEGQIPTSDVDAVIDSAPTENETPYTVDEFVEKYGLSRRAAEVVLMANGPSRYKSDVGARAFIQAVAEYRVRRKGQ